MLTTSLLLSLALLALDAPSDLPDERMPEHSEEIFVVGGQSLLAPVRSGQQVSVVFQVGELDVEAQPIDEVRAFVEVSCQRARRARCRKAKRRMKVEPVETEDGLEVRLGGVSKSLMRRLRVEAKVLVPEDSPLFVKAGIGDVDIRSGHKPLAVRMGIGDLRVYAPAEAVGSVRVRTRIGDAGLRTSEGHRAAGRRALVGAGLSWTEGEGAEPVDVRLRIGDAQVILE
ncbi:MAG: hypothetical protein AAGA81_10785 [Acidobacteriota bacterium]